MSAIRKRFAAVWAGIVAGTVLVVAITLVSGQGPAGAQSEEDVLTGPTLQFGCNVLKVAAIDPIFDPEHPTITSSTETRALMRIRPMNPL